MSRASRASRAIAGTLLSLPLALAAGTASAQDIKTPDGHPDYRLEMEAHGTVAVFRHGLVGFKGGRGKDYFGVPGFGGGIRASIEIADPAFIPKLNNTIGITFGMDVTSCTDACKNDAVLYFPVALQWNFFFSKEWSAFGEVGPMIRADLGDEVLPDLYAEAGGRYLFGSDGALVLRIGFPFVTFGASLFF
jgi:hypothetical protein